jgi:hypothetical protein
VHTFTVRAADAAANVGPAAVVTWTIDARAPVVTITSDHPATTNSPNVSFTFSSDKIPVNFACQLDGGALAACTSPKPYVRLTQGQHTFLVQATDKLGNVGVMKYTWTIDMTSPMVRFTSTPANPQWTTSSGADATFAFTASESPVTFTCKLDSAPALPCISPKTYTAVPAGQHTFMVTATDGAGNPGSARYSWAISVIPR